MKVDAERLLVLADLVGDLLGVPGDGRLFERFVLAEREQVLTDAPVELVLLGGNAALVRDESRLRLEEPPEGLTQVVARLLRRLRHVDDLVEADVRALIRALRLTPGLAVGVVILAQDVEGRERRRGQDLEPAFPGEGVGVGGDGGRPERRVRLLHRLGEHAEITHLEELALEGAALLPRRTLSRRRVQVNQPRGGARREGSPRRHRGFARGSA